MVGLGGNDENILGMVLSGEGGKSAYTWVAFGASFILQKTWDPIGWTMRAGRRQQRMGRAGEGSRCYWGWQVEGPFVAGLRGELGPGKKRLQEGPLSMPI